MVMSSLAGIQWKERKEMIQDKDWKVTSTISAMFNFLQNYLKQLFPNINEWKTGIFNILFLSESLTYFIIKYKTTTEKATTTITYKKTKYSYRSYGFEEVKLQEQGMQQGVEQWEPGSSVPSVLPKPYQHPASMLSALYLELQLP